MAVLNAKRRNALPKKDFGEPGKRAYPMPDKSHARNAKARASQAVNAGRMSKGTEAQIDSKADAVLGDRMKHKPGKVSTVKTDRGEFGFRNHRG